VGTTPNMMEITKLNARNTESNEERICAQQLNINPRDEGFLQLLLPPDIPSDSPFGKVRTV